MQELINDYFAAKNDSVALIHVMRRIILNFPVNYIARIAVEIYKTKGEDEAKLFCIEVERAEHRLPVGG